MFWKSALPSISDHDLTVNSKDNTSPGHIVPAGLAPPLRPARITIVQHQCKGSNEPAGGLVVSQMSHYWLCFTFIVGDGGAWVDPD